MTEKCLSLGIDVGATKIYSAVLDGGLHVLATSKSKTPEKSSPSEIAALIRKTGENALAYLDLSLDDVSDIGVALPSPIDPETGDCLHSPNLGLKNYSVKEHFKKLFKKEVFLGNDVNLGVLGEYCCGSAKGFDNTVGYFLGTGLGGGIIQNGKLLSGKTGVAGELGHTIIKYGGRYCNCGNRGCLEAYCSKVAFVKALKREIYKNGKKSVISKHIKPETANIKSKRLAKAYRKHDAIVRKILRHGMGILGAAAASSVSVLAPDCIVLGGGVFESMGEKLFPIFRKSFEKHLFAVSPESIELRLSVLGDAAVAVGATVLARKKGEV